MLDRFDLQNVCVEKKDDTQVIHIYLDENEQKPDSRDGLHSWYTKVSEFGNKAFNDIAAAMYDREDEILNYFVNRSSNASAESLNTKNLCLIHTFLRVTPKINQSLHTEMRFIGKEAL